MWWFLRTVVNLECSGSFRCLRMALTSAGSWVHFPENMYTLNASRLIHSRALIRDLVVCVKCDLLFCSVPQACTLQDPNMPCWHQCSTGHHINMKKFVIRWHISDFILNQFKLNKLLLSILLWNLVVSLVHFQMCPNPIRGLCIGCCLMEVKSSLFI